VSEGGRRPGSFGDAGIDTREIIRLAPGEGKAASILALACVLLHIAYRIARFTENSRTLLNYEGELPCDTIH